MKTKVIIIAVLAVVLLAGGLFFIMQEKDATELPIAGTASQDPLPVPSAGTAESDRSLGASIYQAVESPNPVSAMPNANPFDAPVNPVKEAYQNPFE